MTNKHLLQKVGLKKKNKGSPSEILVFKMHHQVESEQWLYRLRLLADGLSFYSEAPVFCQNPSLSETGMHERETKEKKKGKGSVQICWAPCCFRTEFF